MRNSQMTGLALVLVLGGCSRGCGEEPSVADGSGTAQKGRGAYFASPVPDDDDQSPTKIVIKNHTGKHIQLDFTHGQLGVVHVAPLDASLGTLMLDRPDGHCSCPCAPDATCPECEPPRPEYEEMELYETLELEWNGLMRRHRVEDDGDFCFDAFRPPSGLYIISVCEKNRQYCSAVRMKLPTRMPVLLEVERSALTVDRCPLASGEARRLTTYHLVRMELAGEDLATIASCDPASATCLDQHLLPEEMEKLGGESCSLFVVPRRSELESLIVTRNADGEITTQSAFYDPYGTNVLSVKTGP